MLSWNGDVTVTSGEHSGKRCDSNKGKSGRLLQDGKIVKDGAKLWY